ncbi:helix-turn-helix domain-containing protein [Achromobacter xylosoxidans]|uniref:transcriptional regulator n=1 Tax=Alcaligenes xylosoxydans xylosoxydans TaxID=85698 RepID=UPI00203D5C05|nr:YdaS family helix-turn-helix protein [Achromobacter xylosoxidans]MCM2569732.1 helix-turn-helix domain-containing protein [Achromobacter xylosoxidans]
MKLATYLREQRGRLSDLARSIGAHAPDVSAWSSGTRPVPARHCAAIERATCGSVTRQDLRPDDYWLIWPDLPAPPAAHQESPHA